MLFKIVHDVFKTQDQSTTPVKVNSVAKPVWLARDEGADLSDFVLLGFVDPVYDSAQVDLTEYDSVSYLGIYAEYVAPDTTVTPKIAAGDPAPFDIMLNGSNVWTSQFGIYSAGHQGLSGLMIRNPDTRKIKVYYTIGSKLNP